MDPPPPADALRAPGFFDNLPQLQRAADTFDVARYRPAPDDWALAVTDIVDSTIAIANGRHKAVNFVAAMAIAAAKNLCAPQSIPFLFGGDGAVIMLPPQHIAQARIELARARGASAREYGMALRVGLVPVAALRRYGCDVRVGRYEPSPGNSFGVFLGGGVTVLEDAVRGRGHPELQALSAIPETLDDGAPVDLSGLSCRWDALHSQHGKMLTLIIHGAPDPGALHAAVLRLAQQDGDPSAVREATLRERWPPKGFMLEARARQRGGWLVLSTLQVLAETLLARLVMARGKPLGRFDPQRYRQEVATNTDFCRHDETLCFVMDCALARIEAISRFMADHAAAQGFRYGMDVADTALMTCLVTSASEGLHVHFVDGGGGGYTNAAKQLKAAARSAQQAAGRPAV
jgi:hypothetical protein